MKAARWLGSFVAGALLTSASAVWAQDSGPRGITGTVSFDNAHHAYVTSGAVFGAVKVIDRTLRFTGKSPAFQVNYEANWIFNAVQVPSVCPVDDGSCPGDGYALQSVDVLAGGLGLASCAGSEADGFSNCLFFGTGFTSAVGAPSVPSRFGLATVMTPAAPFLGMLYTAGVMKSEDPKPGEEPKKYVGGLTPSYIVGWNGTFPALGHVRLGYLSSTDGKGMYTDFSGMPVKAFLTAAFADSFSRLPFFSSGLKEQLTTAYETVGATSAYVRKVDMSPPNLPESESLAGAVDFWTAHLEQNSIGKMFDISGAMAFQPTTLFHAVTAGIHTPNVAVPRDERGKAAWGDDEGGVGFGVHAGLVNLPKLAYYGAQGGRSFYVSADLESQSITSSSETRFALSLRRNDPETLALFPYAQNALGLYMQVSGGWK